MAVHKVRLSEVKWLEQPLASASSGNVTITVEGKEYLIGVNETDSPFGDCNVNGKSGQCRHLEHCALEVFKDDISLFSPYKCPITGEFLGVCCPPNAA